MNSYQSMGVPPSASSFAQFYHQAAAASAVSAASAGVVGVDSLGNCTQSSTGVVSTAGSAGAGLPDLPRYPWMALTGGNYFFDVVFRFYFIFIIESKFLKLHFR